MAAYVSDRDLDVADGGTFTFVLAVEEPPTNELKGDAWVAIPEDASAIVVREYIADRTAEVTAELTIETLDPPALPVPPTDSTLAEQFTGMAWTMAKLTTLHRSIRPDLLAAPNQLVTAEAADLGAANTTPDNLYMIGTFRLADDEALVIELEPPDTRYWSVTVENIWHECIDPRRRHSHITIAGAVRGGDGNVQLVVSATEPRVDNWLDTGRRHRGFIVVRWLDNPGAPQVTTRVLPLAALGR